MTSLPIARDGVLLFTGRRLLLLFLVGLVADVLGLVFLYLSVVPPRVLLNLVLGTMVLALAVASIVLARRLYATMDDAARRLNALGDEVRAVGYRVERVGTVVVGALGSERSPRPEALHVVNWRLVRGGPAGDVMTILLMRPDGIHETVAFPITAEQYRRGAPDRPPAGRPTPQPGPAWPGAVRPAAAVQLPEDRPVEERRGGR